MHAPHIETKYNKSFYLEKEERQFDILFYTVIIWGLLYSIPVIY